MNEFETIQLVLLNYKFYQFHDETEVNLNLFVNLNLSHPLGFAYDNDYIDALTPNYLLFGRNSNDTQKCKFVNEIESTKHLNHANMLLNHIW